MGQRYIPELHDPKRSEADSPEIKQLTDEEAERLFNAAIAQLDAEQRSPTHMHLSNAPLHRGAFFMCCLTRDIFSQSASAPNPI